MDRATSCNLNLSPSQRSMESQSEDQSSGGFDVQERHALEKRELALIVEQVELPGSTQMECHGVTSITSAVRREDFVFSPSRFQYVFLMVWKRTYLTNWPKQLLGAQGGVDAAIGLAFKLGLYGIEARREESRDGLDWECWAGTSNSKSPISHLVGSK